MNTHNIINYIYNYNFHFLFYKYKALKYKHKYLTLRQTLDGGSPSFSFRNIIPKTKTEEGKK